MASRITIDGSFSCNGSGVIVGKINGDVKVEGNITLAKKGVINGNVKAASITVKGTINGNVYCEGKMKVASGAFIKGNIITGEIDVEKNAVIEGSITKQTSKDVLDERNFMMDTTMITDSPLVFAEEIAVETLPVIEEAPKEKAAQTWF